MINRDDYVLYSTRSIYKISSHSMGFSIPKPLLKLLELSRGDEVSILMARDMSHVVVKKAENEGYDG